jgi:hypothetical protein
LAYIAFLLGKVSCCLRRRFAGKVGMG